jgi:hypothetical protein
LTTVTAVDLDKQIAYETVNPDRVASSDSEDEEW